MKILALFGRGNKGKTKTINILIDKYLAIYGKVISVQYHGEDKCCVIEYKNKKLIVTTRGDDVRCLKEDFETNYEPDVDIFICATRSKGETHNYIRSLTVENNIYWLSKATFFNKVEEHTEDFKNLKKYRNTQNETQAKEMLNILDDFLL